MLLSVIIVHYRVPLYLEQCICSLKVALSDMDTEIIVVDNHIPALQKNVALNFGTRVQLIDSGGNVGFAAACNLGWRRASGQYILFLNPDTLITAHAIKTCLNHLQHTQTTGAVGCKLVNGLGYFLPESKRSLPSLFSAGCKLVGLSSLFPRSVLFNQYAMGHINSQDACAVDVLTGAFLMVPRKVLEMIEGFDETFFLYGEDVDCCRRINAAGYTCWYEGSTSVIHFKGASSRRRGRHYFKHFYRAMIVYCNKYYPFPLNSILQAAIYTRRILHQTWSFLRHFISPPPPFHADQFRWLLVSKEEESKQLIKAFTKTYPVRMPVEEIGWDSWLAGNKENSYPARIIFCIGELSLAEVIKWREQHPTSAPCFYWHINSRSLVGSETALSLDIE